MAASTDCLRSSRSGRLSWIKSAPAAASLTDETIVSRPSGGDRSGNNRACARRALPITASSLRPNSGSGSKIATSWPLRRNRAAQPPPMTPPRPGFVIVSPSFRLPQLQLLAHLSRTEHFRAHRRDDGRGALDQLSVGGEDAAIEKQIGFKP